MSAADYDAHRLGEAQEWADASEHPLTLQWDALAEAEARGEELARCRCGDGCSRCHGAGWLTLAQAGWPRLPAEPDTEVRGMEACGACGDTDPTPCFCGRGYP